MGFLDRISDRALTNITQVLDDNDLPNDKRAAVTIIELRTRLEIYKMGFKFSTSIVTGLVGAIVVKLLLL
jgi:hypothetical protein